MIAVPVGLGAALPGAAPRPALRFVSHEAGTSRSTMILRRSGAMVDLLRARDGTVLATAASGRGRIEIHGSSGDDTLVVDYSRGNPVPPGGLVWDGGAQRSTVGDAIVVRGGSFRHGEIHYTSRPDGVVRLDGSTITYRGLEPMDISGLTIANLTLVLPATSDTAVLEDNGTAGDNKHRLRDAGSTFETTVFSTPTTKLTILMGGGTDDITVQPVDSFNADVVLIDQAEAIHLGSLQTTGVVGLKSAGPVDQVGTTGAPNLGQMAAEAGTGVTLTNGSNRIGTLAVSNAGGAVDVTDAGALGIGTVAGVDTVIGVSNTGTTTAVGAASPIAVGADITSAGTLTLTATDTAASGDDVTIAPGVAVESTAGDVAIDAGDNATVPATSAVKSPTGTVAVTVDAGNADPGSGGVLKLSGSLVGAASVSGGTDADRFVLQPDGAVSGLSIAGGTGRDSYQFKGGGPLTAALVEPGGCVSGDSLSFALPSGITLDLGSIGSQAVAPGLTLALSAPAGFENVTGTNFADDVTGNGCGNSMRLRTGADVATGLGGNDLALGNRGADDLTGGAGSDRLTGGTGHDGLSGGLGADDLDSVDGAGGDTVDGGSGTDTCSTDPGDHVSHCEA